MTGSTTRDRVFDFMEGSLPRERKAAMLRELAARNRRRAAFGMLERSHRRILLSVALQAERDADKLIEEARAERAA